MKNLIVLLAGAGLGAGIMYVLDPDAGRRRRALARDKIMWAGTKTKQAAWVTAQDLKNRTVGIVSEARSHLSENGVSDEVLAERVRSKLGFLVRHPSAIEVWVTDGRVVLSGPVLADEVEQLLAGVRSVQGVHDVENRLEVHTEPGNVPALQGDKPKPTGQSLDILQQRWSPSTRFLVGTLGALFLYFTGGYKKKIISLPALVALTLLAYFRAEEEMFSPSPRPQQHNGAGEITAGWST